MSVLISVLFSFISSLALGALVYPYVDRYTDHRFSREIDVPYLGPIPILVFVLAPICIVCVGTWLLTKRSLTEKEGGMAGESDRRKWGGGGDGDG